MNSCSDPQMSPNWERVCLSACKLLHLIGSPVHEKIWPDDANRIKKIISVKTGQGISSDSYVLQGGAPTGCDNGDSFETTQAQGHFTFSQTSGVPEPGTLVMLGSGALGLFGVLRRKLIG